MSTSFRPVSVCSADRPGGKRPAFPTVWILTPQLGQKFGALCKPRVHLIRRVSGSSRRPPKLLCESLMASKRHVILLSHITHQLSRRT
jgi:hypothetical protein